MRICVVGMGKVGRPILEMLRKKGVQAVGYDHVPRRSEVSLSTAVEDSDAAIFIVQTPSLPDGSFSNEYLLEALTNFKRSIPMLRKPDYLYIITSTTVPGSCELFRQVVGDNICYKPEFIRLEHVDADLVDPSFILIGEGCQSAGDKCQILFRMVHGGDITVYDRGPLQIPRKPIPIHRMSLTEAELAKITLNCALTMKISLANQLHLVAEKMGCDSRTIMRAVGSDPRIGQAYLDPGWPYSGPCLPRDNRMFQFTAERVGIRAHLSEAADKINEAVGLSAVGGE